MQQLGSKYHTVFLMLTREQGTTVDEAMRAVGWTRKAVTGAFYEIARARRRRLVRDGEDGERFRIAMAERQALSAFMPPSVASLKSLFHDQALPSMPGVRPAILSVSPTSLEFRARRRAFAPSRRPGWLRYPPA